MNTTPTTQTPPTLYDDTYHGCRWRYGLRYRPVSQAPRGWIVYSDRPHPAFRPHGTIDYPAPLPDDVVTQHGLTLVSYDAAADCCITCG